MKISGVEQAFRTFLKNNMGDVWMSTWHEDREISPGVPDLHYVMFEEGCEFRVGWLELKAVNKKISKTNTIKVEPSQHQYIRRWHNHMPIHFLVRIISNIYLIPGKYHKELALATCESDVAVLADVYFHPDNLSVELPIHLKYLTRI